MAVVLEIGPATVRRLGGPAVDPAIAAAALDAIDDPVVLVDESPVAADEVWRTLLASLISSGPGESVASGESVVIVHPSCWPQRRVDVVVRAVDARAGNVLALPRRELIAGGRDPRVVIEIGDDEVAVSNGAEVEVRVRADTAGVARVAGGWARPSCAVLLDAPRGLPGGDETAAAISNALWADRITARRVDIAGSVLPAGIGADLVKRQRRPVAAGAAAALLVGGLAVVAVRAIPTAPVSDPRSVRLVEGSVAVDVPAGWGVRRVTQGPGSPRVQVTSPEDPGTALHVTQTYSPGTSLAQAADVLGRAVGAEPAGVFVDFRPHDEVAGRPAVTYREIRPGKVVAWSVLLVGATRVSIGCQSAAGREDSVTAACRDALRSAREFPGTPLPAAPSN